MPSQERLKEKYNYDPDTGVFTHAKGIRKLDKVAGCPNKNHGYVMLHIDGFYYTAQRVAYVWMTGEDPGDLILDHINRVKTDNSWENLRLVTHSQNAKNIVRAHTKQPYPHVRQQYNSKTFFYRFTAENGKRLVCTGFKTAEAAYNAYLNNRTIHHA